ncbi:MAG: transposase [bacterium]|nr:transposase [bacterium]
MNDRVDLQGLHPWGSDWEGHWKAGLGELGGYVKRAEVRARLGAYVRGLPGPLDRRTSWQLAEQHGEAHPCGFQHLLNRACWDTEGCGMRWAAGFMRALRDEAGVLIVDKTGFPKKGRHSAGGKAAAQWHLVAACWSFDCLYNAVQDDAWTAWAMQHPSASLFVFYQGSTRELSESGSDAL